MLDKLSYSSTGWREKGQGVMSLPPGLHHHWRLQPQGRRGNWGENASLAPSSPSPTICPWVSENGSAHSKSRSKMETTRCCGYLVEKPAGRKAHVVVLNTGIKHANVTFRIFSHTEHNFHSFKALASGSTSHLFFFRRKTKIDPMP